MRWLVGVLACAAGVAHADRYSETFVDRPLVLYGGMTSLDMSEDVARYSSSGIRYDNEFDLYLEHSFGVVDVAFHGVGITESLDLSFPLRCDDAITVALTHDETQTYLKYGYAESVRYTHVARAVPHLLALYESVSVAATEESLTPAMAPASAGTTLTAAISAAAQVQLTPRLAFDIGGGASFPVAHSTSLQIDPRAAGNVQAELAQTLHAWDFYANIGIGDVTDTHYVFGSAGLVHRWGG